MYSHKSSYHHDNRGYSQSPQHGGSYHNSPAQSPYGGNRPAWGGQFSPSQYVPEFSNNKYPSLLLTCTVTIPHHIIKDPPATDHQMGQVDTITLAPHTHLHTGHRLRRAPTVAALGVAGREQARSTVVVDEGRVSKLRTGTGVVQPEQAAPTHPMMQAGADGHRAERWSPAQRTLG